MSKSFVGVDIGSTSVRVVKVKGIDDDGFAVIEAFQRVPLRGDAVVAGVIKHPQPVAQALVRALKSVKARPGTVIFGAAAPEVAVARLSLPAAVRPEERVKAIRTQGVQVSPAVPTAEAALSANFVRTETTGDGRKLSALVVGATLQKEVDVLMQVARLANITPRAIDLAGVGTMRALVRDLPGSQDKATIVDIGATSTTIVTRQGLHVRSIRSFPSGGLELTRAISQASREPFEEAERRKYSMRLPTTQVSTPERVEAGYAGIEDDEDEAYQRKLSQQTVLEQSLATAAENLVDQIAQAIELDSDAQGVPTRHVALCGGTALMRGLKERLQRRIGVEVRIGHPWARLERSKAHDQYFHNGREDPRLLLSLATATGLALWREAE